MSKMEELAKVSGAMAEVGSVDNLEALMLKEEQVDCPISHHFAPGVYMREMFAPAGTIIVGHHHKTKHMNILLKGSMSLVEADGRVTKMEAPLMFLAEPGRKCAYVHEDIAFVNVHPTEETDLEIIEATFIEKSAAWEEHHKMLERANQIAMENAPAKEI
jgi:hypothetical protein